MNTIKKVLLTSISSLMIFLGGFATGQSVTHGEIAKTNIIKAEAKILTDKDIPVITPVIRQELPKPVIEPEIEVVDIQYPLTQEEIELIALVTMGEAEGESEYGLRLVIDTILNRVDDSHFPNTVNEVIYQPHQFSVMWNGRLKRCYVMPEIVELVKEELLNRTNNDCIFFMSGRYSKYGVPMFQEGGHYFSSYK